MTTLSSHNIGFPLGMLNEILKTGF